MRVLLVITDSPHYAGTGFAEAWTRALQRRGCAVDRLSAIPPEWARDGVPSGRWALAIGHVLVEEVAVFAPTMQLTSVLECAGVPLLNSLRAIATSADKLATHAAWATQGLRQPATVPLDTVRRWPRPGRPMVLKPALGDGARHISLVRGLDEARALEASWRDDERRDGERRGRALLQDWIEEPTCTRLYATPHRTSLAYEKARDPGALVTHGTVYPRVREPPAAMADLARRMVAALGGGLMGVDVLTGADGRHWALEANAPFGFDITDPGQARFLAARALECVRPGLGDSRGAPRTDERPVVR
jgi:glutathione synthase/RimK-type ligase-like ATP-grasp enzyme